MVSPVSWSTDQTNLINITKVITGKIINLRSKPGLMNGRVEPWHSIQKYLNLTRKTKYKMMIEFKI